MFSESLIKCVVDGAEVVDCDVIWFWILRMTNKNVEPLQSQVRNQLQYGTISFFVWDKMLTDAFIIWRYVHCGFSMDCLMKIVHVVVFQGEVVGPPPPPAGQAPGPPDHTRSRGGNSVILLCFYHRECLFVTDLKSGNHKSLLSSVSLLSWIIRLAKAFSDSTKRTHACRIAKNLLAELCRICIMQ